MIVVNITFSTVTPESAGYGYYTSCGYEHEDLELSFRELVDMMREHSNPSDYPCDGDINTWFSSDFYCIDYSTGEEKETSLHYSRKNPSKNTKYWRWAAKAAGHIK